MTTPRTEPSRPEAERLLHRAMAEERKAARERLKIFIGYASGVGKTIRMFEEARRRKERGQDVVVAAVQPQLEQAAQALLAGLELIPTQTISGVEVLDLDAILKRRPGVCFVDGVAYDNPPGCRNAHRWQDVQLLVRSGITVVTSLNLQHVEELRPEVERITGKRVKQTVPKAFVAMADEIVVVDAPSEMLVARNADGSGSAELARKLSALREMTLLLTAEVVDRQLEDYLNAAGSDCVWSAHERILVWLTPRANYMRMLASGRRNADRFHGDLFAVYVEQHQMEAADKERLERAIEEAHNVGATVSALDGEDPVEAVVSFARSHRITQMFVGHSKMERPWRRWLGGPLDRLIRDAEGIDIRIYPDS
jgi:two-component system sensor histidine kinase KdpD